MYSRKYSLLLVAVFLGLSLITITACGGNGADTADAADTADLMAKIERLEARVEELEAKTEYIDFYDEGLLSIDANLRVLGGNLLLGRNSPESDIAILLDVEDKQASISILNMKGEGDASGMLGMIHGNIENEGGQLLLFDSAGELQTQLP